MQDEPKIISYEKLINQLNNDDPYIRGCAAFSLGKDKYEAALDGIRSISSDDSSWVRGWSIFAMGKIQSPESLPYICKGLGDDDPWVREKSCEALIHFKSPLADEALLGMLSHKSSQVRAWSIYTIAMRCSSESTPMDLIPFLEDENRSVRITTVRALYTMGDPKYLDQVKMFIDDPDIHLRGAANYALGVLGNNTIVPDLIKALGDASPWVRRNAAWSLLSLRESLDLVASLYDDIDVGVKTFARYAKALMENTEYIDSFQ